MAGFKHFVLVRFKEGVLVEEILGGLEKLAAQMDSVKSFEWGQDTGSEEMLRQGFTHAFSLGFERAEDFAAFSSHPNHLEFAAIFGASVEKIIVFDFVPVLVKSPPSTQ